MTHYVILVYAVFHMLNTVGAPGAKGPRCIPPVFGTRVQHGDAIVVDGFVAVLLSFNRDQW